MTLCLVCLVCSFYLSWLFWTTLFTTLQPYLKTHHTCSDPTVVSARRRLPLQSRCAAGQGSTSDGSSLAPVSLDNAVNVRSSQAMHTTWLQFSKRSLVLVAGDATTKKYTCAKCFEHEVRIKFKECCFGMLFLFHIIDALQKESHCVNRDGSFWWTILESLPIIY